MLQFTGFLHLRTVVIIISLRGLCGFTFFYFPDENGKDQGINIRQKVKEMVEFAQDDDRLREERKKAKKNKDKYIGVSSESADGFRYSEYRVCAAHGEAGGSQ